MKKEEKMNKNVIKFIGLRITNFKNIKKSEILFSEKDQVINTIGIYGQNGSGKTAIIEILNLFKNLLLDVSLQNDLYYYINTDSDTLMIDYNLSFEKEDLKKYIKYSIKFKKNEKLMKAILVNESIEICDTDKNVISKLSLKKIKNSCLLESNVKNVLSNDLIMAASQISEQLSKTMLFQSFVVEKISNDMLKELLISLKYFSMYNLFVVGTKQTSLISAIDNIVLNIRTDNKNNNITSGSVVLNLFNPTIVPVDLLDKISPVIIQINNVMNKLIPNFELSYKKVINELDQTGKPICTIQLVSLIDENEIPLKYESEGIKKLISLCSTLIAVYNNESVCLVVDELDSGIFEYLLGGLVKVIQQGSKGQLIFTSHNLRLLETLPKKCIIFSTTNNNKRFIKMANVKTNNNLRDFYLRAILLGGQKEELYSETDEFEIERSFKKCKLIL